MDFNFRSVLLAMSALSGMALVEDAEAQSAPVASGAIEEVLVTAQRRTESLQETPIAVTALGSEEMEQRNVQSTQDLMQVTPSLQVSTQTSGNGSGSATFFLRGMGQQRSGNGSEPAVGIYVDDFYYPSLQGTIFSIVDLESVEVLRGPQGTLFGRNTIGGAIRYTSTRPTFENTAHIQGTVGSYDRRDASGVVNFAFSDSAAGRLTLGRLRTDGYVKQANGGEDAGGTSTDLARLQLRFAPGDAWDIELSGQYSRSQLDGYTYALVDPIDPLPGTLPFIYNTLPQGQANPFDDRYRSRCDYCQPGTTFREFADNKYRNATAKIQYDLSDALTVMSLSSWQQIDTASLPDIDGTPPPVLLSGSPGGIQRNRTTAYSQEFQLNGNVLEDRLNWISGIYFYKEKQRPELYEGATFGVLTPATDRVDRRQVESQAIFVDGNYKLTDRASLIAGIRYSKDDKDANYFNRAGAQIAAASASFESTTGRAGAQFQWTPEIMTYATVSKGFRGGGFNANQATGQYFSFDPEDATSYEIGARMDLFDRRLRLNPTVFYTDWKDIQVQSVVVLPGTTTVNVVLDNAAKAHSSGLELEAEGAITDKFRLFGNLALLDIKYDSIGSATGITLNSRLQRAPDMTYAVGARYQTPVFGGFTFRSTANWSWQDVQYSTPTDADTLRLPSYGLLSARLELANPDDKWAVSVFGTNLTQETYYVGGVNYRNVIASGHYDLGRPREYGLSFRYDF